jgi:hypothetical protein
LRNGVLLACGDVGALLRLDLPAHAPLGWERTGHLYAIARRSDGGASVVGSGGHALLVSPTYHVQLEAVQTTRDLWAVATGPSDEAWACGASGRVLRRGTDLWERIAPDVDFSSRLIAMSRTADGWMAMGDDGTVVELHPARDAASRLPGGEPGGPAAR